MRFWSSLLWIQIYRLGVSYVDSATGPRDPDFDLRNSFLSPATSSNSILRQCSHNDSDDALGGAIYDPAYYSSLFEDRQQHNRNSFLVVTLLLLLLLCYSKLLDNCISFVNFHFLFTGS